MKQHPPQTTPTNKFKDTKPSPTQLITQALKDPSKVRDLVQGTVKFLNRDSIPIHEFQQAIYRSYLCAPCLANSRCIECGCATPYLFFAPNRRDRLKRWGPFLSQQEWETFKNNSEDYSQFLQQLDSFIDEYYSGYTIDTNRINSSSTSASLSMDILPLSDTN